MRKSMLFLLFVLCLGAGMPKMHVKAAQTSVSHGNLIYEENYRNASLYAADIHLLEEKISTIPEQCFDPVCYAHTHNWEYYQIDERTHTRHCADCGDANDLTSVHRADRWESDTIFYEGKTYPARRYTCACGYQWRMELSHTITYEAVDEWSHRGRCALDGTPYCLGYEPSVEEHYAWYYEMCEEESHHKKICLDCGYQIEEACSFIETEGDESQLVCICGRSVEREEASETPDKTETGDPSGTPDESESKDAPGTPDESENEDAPGTPDESENEDAPGTPDESESEDAPEMPDESENGDTPGTSDESETEEPPGISDRPGTGDALEKDNIRVDPYRIA